MDLATPSAAAFAPAKMKLPRLPLLKRSRAWCCAAVVLAAAGPAQAETLRCNGMSTEVGDSRLSVLYKCGEPLLRDSFCAPVFYPGGVQPVPDPFSSLIVPCLVVDEWVYDRGPGNLVATVRFRSGVVQSIRYGRTPQ